MTEKTEKKKHRNIPVFIPHYGCGNECIFCNQRFITGNNLEITENFIVGEIEGILKHLGKDNETEIAFFGGSFTGINRETMLLCLNTAYEYVKKGEVSSLRISTRPDYISEETLCILGEYGVKSIELGIQSMYDDVLAEPKRGHTAADTEKACGLIKKSGYNFSLTGQMMVGMYKSTAEKDVGTAKKIIEMGADSARIYPTIVIKDTELFELRTKGLYKELTLEEAISRSASVKRLFDSAGVKILRMGLCASDLFLDKSNFFGPFHPAFGELVESEILLQDMICAIDKHLECEKDAKIIKITANKKNISKIIGQNGKNKVQLRDRYSNISFEFKTADITNTEDTETKDRGVNIVFKID